VLPRDCDDDFDEDDLADDDFEDAAALGTLRARDFFEGPHVFIVGSTVPTHREPNRACPPHHPGRMTGPYHCAAIRSP